MKNIIKLFLIVMALVLVVSVFTACEEQTPAGPDCEHKNIEFVLGKTHTCTEDGLTSGFRCKDCGTFTVPQQLDPAGHDFVVEVKAVAPTCEKDGYTAHMQCNDCTETQGKEVIPATGHKMTHVDAKAPTCGADGHTAYDYCANKCGFEEGYVKQPATGNHTEVIVSGTAATCTTAGLTDGKKCSVCDKTTVAQTEIPAKGHNVVTVPGTPATCTTPGKTEGKQCTTCGTITVPQTEIPAGHKVGEDLVCEGCGVVCVSTQSELQKALDNAVKGTTIKLAPGAEYGVVYLRPSANEGVTKVVDWVGNNYRYETYSLFENLTILGAEGATIDAIEIEANTYYNAEHSQSGTYPIMLSLIELKNVLIEGVTFTGKGGYDPQGHGNALDLSEQHVKVDGLTLKNCVLQNEDNNARLLYRTGKTDYAHKYIYEDVEYSFYPTMKNITVEGCVFNGGYIGIELREAENLTIINNEFNVADRNILLPVNTGFTYSGIITIAGNISNNAAERFVRADGIGMATLVISGNTINNYKGADADYIKVTGISAEYTVENNIITDGTEESRELVANIVHSHIEEVIPGKEANCTEAGLTDGKKCSACDETLVAQEVIPAGHNIVDGACTGCGYIANVFANKLFVGVGDAAGNIYSSSFGYQTLTDGIIYEEGKGRFSSKQNGGKVEGIIDLGAVYDLNEFKVYIYWGGLEKLGTGFEIQVCFGGEWTTVVKCESIEEMQAYWVDNPDSVDKEWLIFDLGGVVARQVKFTIPGQTSLGWSTFYEMECSAKLSDQVEPEPEEPVFVDNIFSGKAFTPTSDALASVLAASWWKGGGYETLTDGVKDQDQVGRFSTVMKTTGMMDATIDLGGEYELHSLKFYTYDPAAGTGATSLGTDLLVQVYADGEWKDVVVCADNATLASYLVVNEGTFNDYLEFDLGGITAEKVRFYISASASSSGTTYEEIECNGYQK